MRDPFAGLPLLQQATTKGVEAPHRRWHDYYRSVYGENVSNDVDLRQFTWFYWDAPLGLDPAHVLPMPRDAKGGVPIGRAWRGAMPLGWEPEGVLGSLGFFRMAAPEPASHFQRGRIEVLRVRTRWTAIEAMHGVAWFFHCVGSGVFLEATPSTTLRVRNRAEVFMPNPTFS